MGTIPPLPASRRPPVGRDRELGIGRQRLTAAHAGRGGLLLISGEAGAGKSAIAELLAREAVAAGARLLLGHCYDRIETPPYGPWIESFATLALGDSPPLSDVSVPDPVAAPGQAAFFARVNGFFAALAAERPLILVLEDLHWADAASLDLLRFLARSLAARPLLVVATYRDDELHRRHPLAETIPLLVREAPTERLDLRPLDIAASQALVRVRYGLPAADAARLATHLIERTEGNALFMTELLRTLEEERVLRPEGERWRLGALTHVSVPPLLRQVIGARVNRLGDASYGLLGVAAVIGQEVPLAVWQTVAQADDETLVAVTERAEAAHLVTTWASGNGIRFTHALIREVLYDGVHPMRRRRLHAAAGDVLAGSLSPDPDAVAYHLQRAVDERAVAWLVRAADRAEESYAPLDAADRYAAAFAFLDARQGDPAERGWLRLLAASLRHYQDPRPANDWVEAAIRLAAEAGDASLAARALAMRGLLRGYRGELAAGIADLAAAVDAADRLPLAPEPDRRREERIDRIANRGTRIAFLAYAGRLAEARAAGELLLDTFAESPSTPAGTGVLADVHTGLSMAYVLQGAPILAARSYAAAIEAYLAMGHQMLAIAKQREEVVCVVLPYLADDLDLRERATAAAEAATLRLAEAGTHGAMDPLYARLPFLVLEGHWQEVHRIADADTWNVQQQLHHFSFVYGPLARALGDNERAWQCVRESWPDGPATEPGNRFVPFVVPLLLLGAALALDDGDLDGARGWLDAHARWMDWMGATLGLSEGQALEAEWWRAAGDATRARAHATRALRHATAPRQPLALLAAHRLLGVLDTDEGRGADAEERFGAALALADACRAPYERALVLLGRAELAAASGDGAAATAFLDEVSATCTSLGARPALARAGAIGARIGAGRVATTDSPADASSRLAPHPRGVSEREPDATRGGVGAVPPQPTRLLGRDDEIGLVRALLARREVRLVTLSGPGGVGKTRLALAVAEALLPAFPDGVWFVDLAPVSDPELVMLAIARRLGVGEVAGQTGQETLAASLGDRSPLLLLDNVEHLLAACPAIDALLAAVPGLVILATSREPLHLRREHVVEVVPLPVPDATQAEWSVEALAAVPAVALFVERSTAAHAAFALNADNADAVAELTRRLDGLPLALELAATRTRLLDPAALLARITRGLDVLRWGAPDLPPRQRSLRATLDWSYVLLGSEERALFRRLGVFVGGFGIEAMAAVGATAALGLEPLDALAGLVDKHLVRAIEADAGESRFGQLATVREYALGRLRDVGDDGPTRDRHLAHYLAMAEQADREMGGSDENDWLMHLDAELDNLRAALDWAIVRGNVEAEWRMVAALSDYWTLRGHLWEGEARVAAAMAHPYDAEPALRARMLFAAGRRADWSTEVDRAVADLEGSLAAAEAAGDANFAARVIGILGTLAYARGELDRAQSAVTRLIDLARAADAGHLIGQAFVWRVLFAIGLHGDPREWEALRAELGRPEFLLRGAGAHRALAVLLAGQARMLVAVDATASLLALRESLALVRRRHDPMTVFLVPWLAAVVLAERLPPERIARLIAGVTALVKRAETKDGHDLILVYGAPRDRATISRAAATARETLGEAAFAGEEAAGRALSFGGILDEALGALDEATRELDAATPVPVATTAAADPDGLSAREGEILRLIAQGMTNRQIADVLSLSVRTVERHIANAYGKIGVHGRAAATAYVLRTLT